MPALYCERAELCFEWAGPEELASTGCLAASTCINSLCSQGEHSALFVVEVSFSRTLHLLGNKKLTLKTMGFH